jgi:predicted esterase
VNFKIDNGERYTLACIGDVPRMAPCWTRCSALCLAALLVACRHGSSSLVSSDAGPSLPPRAASSATQHPPPVSSAKTTHRDPAAVALDSVGPLANRSAKDVSAKLASGTWGIARAPLRTDAPRPPVVYLHGMWASPEDSCSFFEKAAEPHGALVCPRGNAPLGAGFMWSGGYRNIRPRLDAALDAAEALAPGALDRSQGGTLVGFSNGAFVAVQVALAEPGRWSGLVLMSADVALDANQLRGAGVKRVVLAAGDWDGTRGSLQASAQRLKASGLDARYLSLGPVGHSFARDMDARMLEAISWVREH